MQARYCLLKVMLEASKDNGFVRLVRDQNNDLVVKLDRSQIRTVGLRAIGDFLLKIGVYKATANITAAKEMYDRYSAVNDEWLAIRKEVLEKKKPRRQFVQAMTKLSADGKKVELVEFDATREGLVESILARFAQK
jgi:dipeptidyl-peptidase III